MESTPDSQALGALFGGRREEAALILNKAKQSDDDGLMAVMCQKGREFDKIHRRLSRAARERQAEQRKYGH
ncbi:MAG: hypothetical protein A3H57_02365 [Candidatus Taylorbacteria bacterium RIFCSPLOWO2_02_FULL_43_11]|uniref:Uncharacterized protein n=1 Tax=Candidatus Taylorbacteria bacterium RIFCSPHIGHO2_02_FULL_43_32b TaxID=1802306 RepID=A0A1G2MHF8_9BACT|nr:MAG: hypothetical protein A2743_03685 [Candidatus Taylorbacteria bacterium RIFCSPHIGHO2_01_FULL_43_47]OHA23335.1 MAG: hypothetical protein A3C72_00580 [Candidatus Taylorbacteria bacterium RIFCSPHIGHO2_02_FULL_43_32b]OHA30308.1 MAG: hypothetical protein A3B08_01820 [Candidatus Taylorbacteria bacterium RIFCSPLOWO2_01_FULL_43_44]OHA36904.1 MAG: hypothetical protein A3H57_02365 [Candidatus Taylorbacteria bacterium RIFCSPLOWO2_02_FULL_43_11]